MENHKIIEYYDNDLNETVSVYLATKHYVHLGNLCVDVMSTTSNEPIGRLSTNMIGHDLPPSMFFLDVYTNSKYLIDALINQNVIQKTGITVSLDDQEYTCYQLL